MKSDSSLDLLSTVMVIVFQGGGLGITYPTHKLAADWEEQY